MVDLKKHPLLMDCYNLSQAIEICGASPELTAASVRAGDVMRGAEVIVDSLEAMTARAAINGALALRYEKALEQVRDGLANMPNPDASPHVTEAIDALYSYVREALK